MNSIKDFIKNNGLKVECHVTGETYFCNINSKDGDYTFSITREKLIEHMRRFASKNFAEAMIKDEKWVMTHFRRLALYWWHIQVSSQKLSHELNIE